MLTTVRQRMSDHDEAASGAVLGSMRILAGVMWLANIHWKVPTKFGQDTGGGLYKYTLSVTRHSPFAPFTWVTKHVILPNFQLFGWVTLFVEITFAALLLIGWKTRPVSLAAAGMAATIMLSVVYYDKADEWSWSYLLMIGLHLTLFASNAGRHLGLDGVLRGNASAARRALTVFGAIGTVAGLLGLFVARSVDFAGSTAKLLGSDAGFVADTGKVTRRWELKLLFFNPLWALLTIAFGILLILGARRAVLAWAGAAGFGVIALVALIAKTFDYARDDGAVQVVSTGSNVAFWAGLALAGALLTRRAMAGSNSTSSDSALSM